jgi:hypothetical protein
MINRADRLSSPTWAGLGLGGLLLSLIAWRVLTLGMAEHLSRADPDAALGWRAGYAEAQLRQLELRARQPRHSEAQRTGALAAIRSAPLDGRGYRMLARQAELRGEMPVAMALYSLAAKRGPRDLPTQGWLIKYSLAHGDSAQALVHIDQILRVQPEMASRMYPILMALAARDPVKVAKVLLQAPPWRPQFMVYLFRQSQDSPGLFGLVQRLRRSPDGLTDAELSAWLGRLVRNRQWGSAYLSWVESLSPEASRRIGNIYNGSFEFEPSQLGFDWRFGRVPGARVSRAQVTGSQGGLALRVEFEDRRVAFRHVRQLLALVPGTYRLEGRVRLDDLRGERGLVWTLTCAENGRVIAETDPVTGRRDWRTFERDLVVPAENCGGQWLTLRVPARIAAEQRLGGVAWFDDLSIQATGQ